MEILQVYHGFSSKVYLRYFLSLRNLEITEFSFSIAGIHTLSNLLNTCSLPGTVLTLQAITVSKIDSNSALSELLFKRFGVLSSEVYRAVLNALRKLLATHGHM